MNYRYELNAQDLIDFNIFHITYSKLARRSFFVQRYILSLSFLILPFILRNFTTMPLEYLMVIFFLLYIYWVAFYPKRIKKIVSRKITKVLAEGKNHSVVGTHNLTITEEEIVDISEHSEARTPFQSVENIVEDKGHIFIYVNANSAHIIPIRMFESNEQKNELLAFLRKKVS